MPVHNGMTRLVALLVLLPALCAAQTVVLYPRATATCEAQAVASLARAWGPACIDTATRPGDPWRAAMAQCIADSTVALILWDRRAAESPEIAAEWRQALAGKRRVVVLRLDDAALPAELAALQWIDWPKCPTTKEPQ